MPTDDFAEARAAIALYGIGRGIRCDPERVLGNAATEQALLHQGDDVNRTRSPIRTHLNVEVQYEDGARVVYKRNNLAMGPLFSHMFPRDIDLYFQNRCRFVSSQPTLAFAAA